ncbi:hypothetical protein PtB15_10B242 [Puccinia triticina]|nr:hypothetical protein PtB15_10B242 [Puccinia triticina]
MENPTSPQISSTCNPPLAPPEAMEIDTILPARSSQVIQPSQHISSSASKSRRNSDSSNQTISNYMLRSREPSMKIPSSISSSRKTSPGVSSTVASTSNFSEARTPTCSSVASTSDDLDSPTARTQDLEYFSDNSTKKDLRTRKKPLAKPKKPSTQEKVPDKSNATDIPNEKSTGGPKLLYEELEALQVAIQKVALPTSVTRVPKEFGSSGNKSLKASEWLPKESKSPSSPRNHD